MKKRTNTARGEKHSPRVEQPEGRRRESMVVPKREDRTAELDAAEDDLWAVPVPSLYCPFAPGLNPDAAAVQAGSVEWAGWMGLVQSEAQRSRLDLAKIGWLEAFVLHTAPKDVLQLAADWTTLFCLLDDCVELDGLGPVELSAYLSRVLGAFRRTADGPNDPIGRGFVDLRERMRALGGGPWAARFAECLEELFSGYVWEEINRWKGIRPSHHAYRKMRTVTIGLRPQFALAELAEGIELSPQTRVHPDVIRLETLTCRAVGWANDLFTYGKELEQGEVHNLVLVLMDVESLPVVDAIRRATAEHDDEIRTFLSTEARLADFGDEKGAMRRYVSVLRRWIRGHLDWAVETGRYRERRTVRSPLVSRK